ncbi:MAG: tetratricopeptide repeat protein [Blastochloris sp.]|nr:tetratricopeptide repeat protein [Blastochloris sp.]
METGNLAPQSHFLRSKRWQTIILLLLALMLGAYFRTISLFTWDEPSSRLHPDERFMTMVANDIRLPSSPGEYFDSSENPLNPRNVRNADGTPKHSIYVYGLLPQTLVRYTAVMLTPSESFLPYVTPPGSSVQVANPEYYFPKLTLLQPLLNPNGNNLTDYFQIHKVGRGWSALFDIGSILLVFLIGSRLYGRRVALLASFLFACAVLPIQLAHFFTVDAATAFFALLTMYWAVRISQDGGAWSFVALGLSIGAAMACRVTMATLGLVAIVAVAQRVWNSWSATRAQDDPQGERFSWWTGFSWLVVAGVTTILTFRVLQPDAFVGSAPGTPFEPDPTHSGSSVSAVIDRSLHGLGFFDLRPEPRYIGNIREVGRMVSGEIEMPPSQQWVNRTPYLFSWQNMVIWGMGIPLGLTAWLGWGVAGWQMFRRRTLVHLLPWVWIAFYFLWQGGQFVMTMRYYLLLYGLLILFAAWGLMTLWDRGQAMFTRMRETHKPLPWWRVRGAYATLWGSRALLSFVFVSSLLWAYGFTRIYTEPHSRIEASRWIYDNVPPGSTISSQSWDDPLPLGLEGRNYTLFIGCEMFPYAEDDFTKYVGVASGCVSGAGLLDQLDQVDYLIYSSNRVYDSATRMPMRYPALTRYYHHLFEGNLGFELVADVYSYPTLFGIEIPDQIAEEAFSVYDHPRVLIFQKTDDYSRANAEDLIINDVAWGEVYKIPSVRAHTVPTALHLTDTEWASYREAGTWTELFGASFVSERVPWLFWLMVVQLIGVATFLMLFPLLRGLPDCGFALSKILGVLLVAYLAWLLGSLRMMAFTSASVWLCVGILVLIGGVVGWRNRAALYDFVRARAVALLTAEALFLTAFFGFLIIRALNPDLWHPARGGEKPMDLAFLTAVLKSPYFPPYDPWFAGGYINYYYFGFVFVGVLVHLTGIEPTIAYNLAVPTIFAMTALGAWGVAYNLIARAGIPVRLGVRITKAMTSFWVYERRAIVTGVIAAVFVVLLGNLAQAAWFLPGSANPTLPFSGDTPPATYAAQQEDRGRSEWAFWDATRVVGMALEDSVINEFPFFTFLFGDLHAHMIVLPLTLAALGLMVALVRVTHERRRTGGEQKLFLYFLLPLLGLVIGSLRVTNTWDYPAYLGLAILTFGIVAWDRWQRGVALRQVLWRWSLSAVALIVLSSLWFWPFLQNFATDYAGFRLWDGLGTPINEFLLLHGLWFFLIMSAGFALYHHVNGLSAALMLAGAGMILLWLVGVVVLQMSVFYIIGPLMLLAFWLIVDCLMYRSDTKTMPMSQVPPSFVNEYQTGRYVTEPPESRVTQPTTVSRRRTSALMLLPMFWALAGLGLLLLPELIVAQGDIGRMNTVFKFGMQSWVLFALVSAIGVVWMWQHVRGWSILASTGWRAAAVALILAALVYPFTATPARLADRYDTEIAPTLDGMAYMQAGSWGENGISFDLNEDADALAWMRQNITGTPIVLEAQTEGYRWGSRVSIYTGLPTLLGWPWHETQQRSVAQVTPVLDNRKAVIEQLYTSLDPIETVQTLQLYGIEYVYVGQLERALYDPAGLAKFEEMATQGLVENAYTTGETTIYRVRPSDQPPAVVMTTLPVEAPTLTSEPVRSLELPVNLLPSVNEYAWNRLADSQAVAIFLWLLTSYGLLLLGLPLAVVVFRRWRDGGVAWARLIGLLLVGYAVWMPVSMRLWQYDRWGLAFGVLIVLTLNAAIIVWLGRTSGRELAGSEVEEDRPRAYSGSSGAAFARGLRFLGAHLRERSKSILLVEGLFLIAFTFLSTVRFLNPDLWHPIWGGEKPFEFGFLNALLRSPVMPPYDPFFSGAHINYYYYGLYLVSLPVKATGIAPAVAFNLIVPTIFAMTLAGAFALVLHLTRRVRYGLVGAAFVALFGNLATALRVEGGWSQGLDPVWQALSGGFDGAFGRMGDWFIGPSRVIPFTINEFPFWSFLFADLHPHTIALPITLLMMALIYRFFERTPSARDDDQPSLDEQRFAIGLRWTLTTLTLGTLAVTNSWDFPTYALLLTGAMIGVVWLNPTRLAVAALVSRLFLVVVAAGGVAAAALVIYLPFFQNFGAQVSGIGLVTDGTHITRYGLLYGMFLAVLLVALFGVLWRFMGIYKQPRETTISVAPNPLSTDDRYPGVLGFRAAPSPAQWLRPTTTQLRLILLMVVALIGGLAAIEPVFGLKLVLTVLIVVGVFVLMSRDLARATWFVIWMAVVGWMVSLGIEFLFIRDHLAGGDWYRMNTVFKFGLQIWMLLAVAAAVMLPHVLRGLSRAGVFVEWIGWTVLIFLVLLSLIFPVIGTPNRIAYRFPEPSPPTLDGLAFMEDGTYNWEGNDINLRADGEAIRWLNENIEGTPIVLQSSYEFYRAYGVRIAANTGLPTVISPLHASEHHDGSVVAERDREVRQIYDTTDVNEALRLLAKYRVDYVYIGPFERAAYAAEGIAKFETLTDAYLRLAYHNEEVRIYAVNDSIASAVIADPSVQEPQPIVEQPTDEQMLAEIEALSAQVAADPTAASSAFGLAQRYYVLGRYDEAADVLVEAALANPQDVALHHLWGDILRDSGRFEEAEEAYRLAVEADPSAGNYNKLGVEALQMGLLETAETALVQVVVIDPNAFESYYHLGRVYDQQDQSELAIENYERYVQLAPSDHQFQVIAAAALERLR